MPSHKFYRPFFANLLRGEFPDLESPGNEIKVALLYQDGTEAPYVFDPDHETFADVEDFEVTDADYTPGGEVITNKTVVIDDDVIRFDTTLTPKETVFTEAGDIKATHAVLYLDVGASSEDKLLISCFDFGKEEESFAGEFKITWNVAGILNVDVSEVV